MTTSCNDCGQVHDGGVACAVDTKGNKAHPMDAWLAAVPVRPPPLKSGKPYKEPSTHWHVLWMIVLALAVSVPVAYWREGPNASYVIGYAIGSALVPVVVALVIMRFSVVAAWVSLLVILGLSIVGYALGDLQRHTAEASLANQEFKALREELKQAAAGATIEEPYTFGTEKQSTATTELEAIKAVRRIFNEAYREQARLGQVLAAEEAKLDLVSVLLPENLVTAQGIARGRQTLDAFEQIHRRRVEGQRVYSQYLDTHMAAEVPRAQFANMWEQYEAGKRQRDPLVRDVFNNQASIMRSAEAILDFMEPRLGATQLEGGLVAFQSQSDVDTYNALLAELDRHAQQESVLTQRMDQYNEKTLKRVGG